MTGGAKKELIPKFRAFWLFQFCSETPKLTHQQFFALFSNVSKLLSVSLFISLLIFAILRYIFTFIFSPSSSVRLLCRGNQLWWLNELAREKRNKILKSLIYLYNNRVYIVCCELSWTVSSLVNLWLVVFSPSSSKREKSFSFRRFLPVFEQKRR